MLYPFTNIEITEKTRMRKFCGNCLKEVNCTYHEKEVEIEIENNKIKYLKKYYVCNECKKEFLDDLYDYDVEVVNNELRKINDIITTEEIEEITTKYNIGKKPLSLILGIGEVNIIRYLNGANPTKEISDLLKGILENPFLYEMFLISNKDNITEIAYKKSLSKTKQLEMVNSHSKIYNASLYMISKLEEMDPLSLQKILYYAFGFSKIFLKEELFSDLPEAWVYGPVYKEIYDCFCYYKGDKIQYNELLKNREFDLNKNEKAYLDKIMECFGCYSGVILKEMTHMTKPWQQARVGLDKKDYSNRIIERKEIENYFQSIYEEYAMEDIKDISRYSNEMFKRARAHFMKNNKI